ncbi:enolase-phosphatase E1-like [Chironomus tepperi]|uniref:enolase-phosphatase E1-like n=1 Tax=Chironomus tepperi TaxID=113505 RepID=UPI00391F68BA
MAENIDKDLIIENPSNENNPSISENINETATVQDPTSSNQVEEVKSVEMMTTEEPENTIEENAAKSDEVELKTDAIENCTKDANDPEPANNETNVEVPNVIDNNKDVIEKESEQIQTDQKTSEELNSDEIQSEKTVVDSEQTADIDSETATKAPEEVAIEKETTVNDEVPHKQDEIAENIDENITEPTTITSDTNEDIVKTDDVPAQTEEITKNTEESQPDESDAPSTSEEKTPLKRKLSDTPEDIINLLKSLSPEKLQEIKSKVLEITTDKKDAGPSNESKKPKIDETEIDKKQEETIPTDDKENVTENKDEMEPTKSASADVICLDSDDEESENNQVPAPEVSKEQITEKEAENVEAATVESKESDNLVQELKEEEVHVNGDSAASRINLKNVLIQNALEIRMTNIWKVHRLF